MDGCELVIHLAAVYALWLPDPTIMFRVNVDGTRNVLKAARRARVKRVVYTSSIAAVGTLPAHGFANETTAFESWDIADDYVLSKVYSEQEALKPEHLDALDVVAVNPAFPFGPGDIGPTPTGRLILAMMRGHLPFVVKGGFNGVDVRDVRDAAKASAKAKAAHYITRILRWDGSDGWRPNGPWNGADGWRTQELESSRAKYT